MSTTVCTRYHEANISGFFLYIVHHRRKFCQTSFQTHLPKKQYHSQSVTNQHAQAGGRG